jgi:hypothetical protein
VPGRDVGLEGEVELAEPAALAPLAQLLADGRGSGWVVVMDGTSEG